MSISENIKKYRKLKGYTQNDLAELLNVRPTTISAWEVGRNKPLMDKVEMLSNILGVKKSDIIGEGNTASDFPSLYNELDDVHKTKVLDYIKHQLDDQNNIRSNESVIGLKEIPRGADEIFMINDDSMSAKIEPKSTVFIHYQPALDFDGEIMLVDVDGEGVTCRKVFCNKETDRLVALNPKYEDRIIPHENVHIIGKVIF